MKRLILINIAAILCTFAISGFTQETKDKKPEIKFGGFIRYDAFYDNRLNVDALEGLVNLFPLNKAFDSIGNDLNNKNTINALTLASRLKTFITAADALGAKTSGFIEFDFTGRPSATAPATIRFREAWIKLKWEKTKLLFGRHWHPLFIEEMVPSVVSMNIGAPFQTFNRSAQMTVKRNIGDFKVLASAIYQSDYLSSGPSTEVKSPNYMKWSMMPNLHLQFQYLKPHLFTGIAIDYKSIQPRLFTTAIVAGKKTYKTDEKLNTYALEAFLKVNYPKFTFKCKSLYGQNLSDHLLTGGYAVKTIDSLTGRETYTPSNNIYVWANAIYGTKWKFSLFGGYSQNLGFSENVINNKPIDSNGKTIETIYGTGNNIAFIYRISPSIIYDLNFLQFCLEYERTSAAYGKNELNNKGKVINKEIITNNRLLFTVIYLF